MAAVSIQGIALNQIVGSVMNLYTVISIGDGVRPNNGARKKFIKINPLGLGRAIDGLTREPTNNMVNRIVFNGNARIAFTAHVDRATIVHDKAGILNIIIGYETSAKWQDADLAGVINTISTDYGILARSYCWS